jgi:hypothetical protein
MLTFFYKEKIMSYIGDIRLYSTVNKATWNDEDSFQVELKNNFNLDAYRTNNNPRRFYVYCFINKKAISCIINKDNKLIDFYKKFSKDDILSIIKEIEESTIIEKPPYEYLLKTGYPTEQEKLNELYWNDELERHTRVYLRKLRNEVKKERKSTRVYNRKNRKKSERVLTGETNVTIIYPSNWRYKGVMRSYQGFTVVEPNKKGLAAWVIDRKSLINVRDVIVNEDEWIKVSHDQEGLEFLDSIRKS